MKRLPDSVNIVFYVDLLAEVKSIIAAHGTEAYGHHLSTAGEKRAPLPRFWRGIANLRGCRETCDSHQAWAQFQCDGRTLESVARDIERVTAAVVKITARCAKT